MDNNRKNIVVHLVKSYEYPLSSLEQGYHIQDAIGRAETEILQEIQHIVNNDFREGFTANFFTKEVEEISPLVLRETVKKNYKSRGNYRTMVPLSNVVTNLAKYLTEKKYGEISQDKNPNAFQKNHNDSWELKEEISDFYNNLYSELYSVGKKNK